MNVVGLTDKLITFDTNLTTTADNFVTDHAAYYLTQNITVTASTGDLTFESTGFGLPFGALDVTTLTGNLTHGVIAEDVAYVAIGTGTITGVGISKTVTFDTDPTTTADNFRVANATYYSTLNITLTDDAGKIVFTADEAGTGFTSPIFTNVTGDIAGAIANSATDYYANVAAVAQVETILVEGSSGEFTINAAGGLSKDVTFDTSRVETIQSFIATNATAYLAQAIVLSGTTTQIVMTAEVAGTGFTAPTISGTTENLAGTVATTDTVSLLPLSFSNAADIAGGGGIIMGLKLETDITAAAETDFRI